MHIGLNGISFYPGVLGGMETYFKNLLRWLQEIDTYNDYTVICCKSYERELLLFKPRFKIKTYNYKKNSLNWAVRGALRNFLNGVSP